MVEQNNSVTNYPEELAIAEGYLKEMLEADDTQNYELYIKRYEEKHLTHFNKEIFLNDIKHMHEQNGMHVSYELLGTLRKSQMEDTDLFRFVWKGIYEKRDAVIITGIYQKNGTWYLIESSVR